MKIDNTGRQFIYNEEGVRLKAYRCSAGVATIGVGCTFYPNGKKVQMGDVITHDQVDTLFDNVVKGFEAAVLSSINVQLNQNQFNALVSFAFNIGVAAFKASTLVKRINSKATETEVREQFVRWINVKGKPNKVLQARRQREASLFFKR